MKLVALFTVIALATPFTSYAVTGTADLEEGQCMGKVVKPAVFKEESYKVVHSAAKSKIEVTPAQWKWVEKKVEVTPAYTVKKVLPAKYEFVTEKVIAKPEHTVLKKTNDGINGEVMCKVKVPATYKSVKKRKLVTEAQTVDKEIPATFKTIKVKELVSAESTKTIEIPEKATEKTRRVLVSPAETTWQRVLCKANSDKTTVTQLQQALEKAGFNPGTVDGVLGLDTYKAVHAFQKKQGLAHGAITHEVLQKLGLKLSH